LAWPLYASHPSHFGFGFPGTVIAAWCHENVKIESGPLTENLYFTGIYSVDDYCFRGNDAISVRRRGGWKGSK
jgi:hypothetical protein